MIAFRVASSSDNMQSDRHRRELGLDENNRLRRFLDLSYDDGREKERNGLARRAFTSMLPFIGDENPFSRT